MAKGIICITPIAIKEDIDLTVDPSLVDLDKLKEVLLLPERYVVEEVKHGHLQLRNVYHDYVEITVSSPDIPEVSEDEALPDVMPCYLCENSEDRKTSTISLEDIKVNNISVIKEDDKKLKRAIKIKEYKEIDEYKDATYNDKIKPLAEQIIAIAKEHDVPCILAIEHREHWYKDFNNVYEKAAFEFKQALKSLEGKVS